jgi:ADP-ribose pyrophosphatase YjhB (NUDIX family)
MFSEPRVGCGAAIIVDERILLLKRKTSPEIACWGLPGGKIDLFEMAASATQREIKEELGIDIEARELLCVVDQIDREESTHWIAPVYLVQSFIGTPAILEPEKHGGLAWFGVDDPPQPLTCAAHTAITTWRQRRG